MRRERLHLLLRPELEFFLFANDRCTELLDHGGYFDAPPLDLGNTIRRDIIFALEQMGVAIEYSHHEVAPSQHEIDMRYAEALKMADITMTYRVVVKEVARKHGVYATFMPKPIYGQNGSGMHVHQSLFKNGKNLFFDPSDKYHLSHEGKSYIAGILKHAREFACVTNQWVNSYKRLVPGYEAPVYVAWARRNRSALVRVPMYKPGKEAATRMELRCPDPAANPYLTFAVMLAAGLKGMENNYVLPEPVEADIFHMDQDTLDQHNITSLPGSLFEAAEEMKHSELVRETLGDHIFTKLYENKIRSGTATAPRSRSTKSSATCRCCKGRNAGALPPAPRQRAASPLESLSRCAVLSATPARTARRSCVGGGRVKREGGKWSEGVSACAYGAIPAPAAASVRRAAPVCPHVRPCLPRGIFRGPRTWHRRSAR